MKKEKIYNNKEQFLQAFDQAIMIDQENGYVYIQKFLWYTDSKVPEERQEELGRLIIDHLSKKEGEVVMRTIAQKYIEEGEARAEAKLIKLMLSNGVTIENIVKQTGLKAEKIKEIMSQS